MCFSAQASFTAAAALGVIGGLTIRKAQKPALRYLAAIPILFALQQFSEGMIWLSLSNEEMISFRGPASYTFLMFAFLIWPIWLPLSLFVVEDVKWRRASIGFLLASGVALSLFNLSHVSGNEIIVRIVGSSIQYESLYPIAKNYWPLKIAYTAIVLLPCFISSLRYIWVYGALLVFSWIAAAYLFSLTFSSVWCYFSAILSITLYIIICYNEKKSMERNTD